MRKVMLFCGLGMSTSLLVKKTQKEAEQRGINDIEFFAASASEYENKLNEDDLKLCLVGPQVRYLMKDVKNLADRKNVKVEILNPVDFSNVNGKKVLDQVLSVIG